MKMGYLFLVFLFITITVPSVIPEDFEGYKLISVTAKSKKEVQFLQALQKGYKELDFWNGPSQHKTNILMLPPDLLTPIEEAMTKEGMAWKELGADVAKIIEDGMRTESSTPSGHRHIRSADASKNDPDDIIDHTNYHSYQQIIDYMEMLEQKYPDIVNISYLKYPSHEGRRVTVIKLHSSKLSSSKSSIVIEAGIHAREWIAPAATIYSIEKLIQRYYAPAGNNNAKLMLDTFDLYIVPVTNPDGYEYTRKGQKTRLWRKNRRLMTWNCQGVDLNRNFDVYFGTTGVSKECDSDIYPGMHAFSEPESANIRELVRSLNESLVVYLSIHAYSQFLIVPWAFSNAGLTSHNNEETTELGTKMVDSIKDTNGKVYKVGTLWDLLEYAASGSAADWALQENPDIYAMSFELRPNDRDERGFNLPPNEIIPTGQELLASLETMAVNFRPLD